MSRGWAQFISDLFLHFLSILSLKIAAHKDALERQKEEKKERRRERLKEIREAKKAGIDLSTLAKDAAERSEEFNFLHAAEEVRLI